MRLLNKIEQKYGRYYISGLAMKLVIIKLVAFLLIEIYPNQMNALYNGEGLPFRFLGNLLFIISFPPSLGVQGLGFIWAIFAFYILHMCSHALEDYWGQWRFNFFILIYIIFASITHLFIVPYSGFVAIDFIDLTCFLAFCTIFRQTTFRLMLIFPVPAWICGLLALFTVVRILFLSIISGNFAMLAFMTLMMANYLIYFIPELKNMLKQKKRKADYDKILKPENDYFHKCCVCGITDVSAPEMEFRYSSKDDRDYCLDHFPSN